MNMILLFFAGLISSNGIPHFFNGISGKRFHSPFAKPFVKGLSSPLLNVIWGLINFFVAVVLIIWSHKLIFGINLGFIVFSCEIHFL